MIISCAKCFGKGRIVDEQTGILMLCDECFGEGCFNIPEEKDLCPMCNGIGLINTFITKRWRVFYECSSCEGRGYVDFE